MVKPAEHDPDSFIFAGKSMPFIIKSGIKFFEFQNLQGHTDIIHFISTRYGGVSVGAYASLNIGFGTDDAPLAVLRNRHLMARALDIPLDYFVMANQVHGNHVALITKNDRGSGAFHKYNAIPSTDALITNVSRVCLFVMAADCVPLLFFDPVKKIIGATHAGWRGTIKQIASATIREMQLAFQCDPADILAGIGPSIGPCCYVVGTEVAEQVQKTYKTTEGFIRYNPSGEPIFDLWYANRHELRLAGLKEQNIETAGICTHCHPDDFYSSRHANGITGRFGAGIMLT